MIGNDIIDLQLAKAQSNWKRRGFLEKQYTEKEQAVILKSDSSFTKVWLLWSMKEAAYKCYVQEHQKRFFNPKKCSCSFLSCSKGIVSINNNRYYTKSIITSKYIHTIAVEQKNSKITSNLFFIEETLNQRELTRGKLLAYFSAKTTLQKNDIGVPSLYEKNKKLPISFSTSHHGNYGGFVILK